MGDDLPDRLKNINDRLRAVAKRITEEHGYTWYDPDMPDKMPNDPSPNDPSPISESIWKAKFHHAKAVLDSFATDIENLCREQQMHPELREALRKAAALARMSVK